MAWLIVVLAGLLEVVWASALARAEGFDRPGWAEFALVVATASVLLLAQALRDLPLGTAYAVWVSIGTLGVAVVGVVGFGETLSLHRVACLLAILGGVVGLKMAEGDAAAHELSEPGA